MSSLEGNAVRMIDCLFKKMQVYSENEKHFCYCFNLMHSFLESLCSE